MGKGFQEIEELRDICKTLVSQTSVEEEAYFDTVWDVMKGAVANWMNSPPSEWPLAKESYQTLGHLGLARADVSLTSPIIIGVVAATLWYIASIGTMPSHKELSEVIGDYCDKFGASSLKAKLSTVLPKLCDVELSKIFIPFQEGFEVWENGQKKFLNEAEVKTLKIEDYDLFIDDLNDQVFYEQKAVRGLQSQRRPRRMLIHLIENRRRLCGYKQIMEEVWKVPVSNESLRQAKFRICEAIPDLADLIKDEPGEGYKFVGNLSHCIIKG
ncbi:MAG: hypothetical protein GTN74_05085 [Proteobacteria bacterium]|nr:hypothetical protein [Pseudomonadota bacterium]